MSTLRLVRRAAAALALTLAAAHPAAAQKPEHIAFILNWVAGGDHAPYFYAQKMGWYKDAGLDVHMELGKGSALAIQKTGAGADQIGLADMASVLTARGKGADVVGVFNVYANSPQTIYWLKSSGIKGLKDLAGKKIGNPAGDAARIMWPALAKANGMDPKSVIWVNIDANSKLAALKAKSIDATTQFYNFHTQMQRELGDDMAYVTWRDIGLNPYGNSVIVNGDYLRKNPKAVAAFVKVTQKAFAACVADPKPCVQALVDANSGLKFDNEMENWKLVEVLMSDPVSRSVALGWHDDKRIASDYDLVKDYIGIEKPYDIKSAYTNEFLDKSVKMTK
jgi:NitT/TauT family transport system substrate-binding protein